jgi:eukaryotic-like serine/threonine-protein kinase
MSAPVLPVLNPGDLVGDDRYELKTRLGSGAFGAVWEADDLNESAVVAVKLLGANVIPDKVLREASLHRRLSEHPRVVSMRNVLTGASPSPLVVLDYVAGSSLDAILAARRPTVRETVRWLRDTLEALRHAHDLDVIHRDIKPSNLLLGPDGHAMLTDFGVAEDTVKRLAQEPGMYHLTLPPEFGTTPTDERTDLWLVGMLGWRLLVGERPDLGAAHAGTLEAPHRQALDVPLALSRAVMPALEPNPASRPQTAERMLQAIAAVPVHAGWADLAPTDPVVAAWQSDASAGSITVEISERRRDFEVRATAPPGHRLRRARRETKPSLAQAKKVARNWLLEVVAGRPL